MTADIIPNDYVLTAAIRLANLWVNNNIGFYMKRMISWGLSNICTPNLPKHVFKDVPGFVESIDNNSLNPEYDARTAILLAISTDHWTKEKIIEFLKLYDSKEYNSFKIRHSRFLKESGFLE